MGKIISGSVSTSTTDAGKSVMSGGSSEPFRGAGSRLQKQERANQLGWPLETVLSLPNAGSMLAEIIRKIYLKPQVLP